MKLKTFPLGGVHPPENKFSSKTSIRALPLPQQVVIPLSQHIGAPANPIVKKGDRVKVGSLIAQASGFISANIHSSVSGIVNRIDEMLDSSGYKKKAIVIDVEGDDWEETIDRSADVRRELNLTTKEVVDRIKDAGIVGLGGATFPSHIKLMVPEGKRAEVVVINAVECEPYLTSDHRLMMEKADEILIGVSIVMKAVGVGRAIIGIENNKKDAISLLSSKAKDYPGIEVQALKVMYPQGGEKQLIKACINREVPSGGLPIDAGVVILNVGTTFAIYEAVQKNKPLVERVVTVTGKVLSNPSNFIARIGTPVTMLLEEAGGLPEDTGKIVNGGPMMGKALVSAETPVTKGTSGILLFKKSEAQRAQAAYCIRCGKCISVCPMGLEPYLLAKISQKYLFDRLEKEHITDCIECGSCSYTCPANLPLLDYVRMGKAETIKIIRARNK